MHAPARRDDSLAAQMRRIRLEQPKENRFWAETAGVTVHEAGPPHALR